MGAAGTSSERRSVLRRTAAQCARRKNHSRQQHKYRGWTEARRKASQGSRTSVAFNSLDIQEFFIPMKVLRCYFYNITESNAINIVILSRKRWNVTDYETPEVFKLIIHRRKLVVPERRT